MKEKVQRQQEDEEIDLRTTNVCIKSRKRHNNINLPRNLCYSDESDVECSSSDDNGHDTTDLPEPEPSTQELSHQLEDLALGENGTLPVNQEVLRKFAALPLNEKYEKVLEIILVLFQRTSGYTVSKDEEYTARSPFRNRGAHQSRHNQTPFDRPDLTVTSLLGNKGNVYVQKFKVNTQPSIIPITVPSHTPEITEPQDNELLEVLNDQIFVQDFLVYLENTFKTVETKPDVPHETMDKCLISPIMTSPITSPNTDLEDSSYETGSPGSTVGTSPAPSTVGTSPAPRTSVSSDSDLELDSAVEHCTLPLPTNIIVIPAQPRSRFAPLVKTEPDVKPLGEVVHYVKMSATQRLQEMSQSTSFCEKQFAIQLFKVMVISKAETSDERLQKFSKSLLETVKMKFNKTNDIDIWQLSLFAHIEILTGKNRIEEYRSALLSRDEKMHSLLYIAAVERNEKPLIARYIVESLAKVGYNPLEVYDSGNTLLHVLADLGDSHKEVLSELLMATGADGRPLLDVTVTNTKGQNALHVAVLSPHQHITTVLILLRMGANPFQEDIYYKTPLHYQIMNSAKQEPRNGKDLEVIRKIIQAQPLRTREALEKLEELSADSYLPSDLTAVIQAEISYAQDIYYKTPLHYQIMNSAKQEPRNGKDLEVIRKIIQAQPLRTREALEKLEELSADSYLPSDLTAVIQAEISYAQDLKSKKVERR